MSQRRADGRTRQSYHSLPAVTSAWCVPPLDHCGNGLVTVSPIIEGRDSQGAYRVPGSELHLVALQGQIADGADHTDTQSQRLAIRPAARQLTISHGGPCFVTQHLLIRHLADLERGPRQAAPPCRVQNRKSLREDPAYVNQSHLTTSIARSIPHVRALVGRRVTREQPEGCVGIGRDCRGNGGGPDKERL